MSLDVAEPQLIADLLGIWETEAEETESPEASRQRIAQKMAEAIKKFIKQGVVVTNGSATTQTGQMT